jgi:hypothetical protein
MIETINKQINNMKGLLLLSLIAIYVVTTIQYSDLTLKKIKDKLTLIILILMAISITVLVLI